MLGSKMENNQSFLSLSLKKKKGTEKERKAWSVWIIHTSEGTLGDDSLGSSLFKKNVVEKQNPRSKSLEKMAFGFINRPNCVIGRLISFVSQKVKETYTLFFSGTGDLNRRWKVGVRVTWTTCWTEGGMSESVCKIEKKMSKSLGTT